MGKTLCMKRKLITLFKETMDIIVKNDDQSVSWKSPELLGIAGILTEYFYSAGIDYLIRGLLCKSYNKTLHKTIPYPVAHCQACFDLQGNGDLLDKRLLCTSMFTKC